jgi:hypothetical protein
MLAMILALITLTALLGYGFSQSTQITMPTDALEFVGATLVVMLFFLPFYC